MVCKCQTSRHFLHKTKNYLFHKNQYEHLPLGCDLNSVVMYSTKIREVWKINFGRYKEEQAPYLKYFESKKSDTEFLKS